MDLRSVAPALLALAACGRAPVAPLLTNSNGSFALVAVLDGQGNTDVARATLELALPTVEPIDVVFAHDDDAALAAASSARDRSGEFKVVAISAGATTVSGAVERGDVAGVMLVPSHGGPAAELAFFAARGVRPPQRDFALGAPLLTRHSARFGGETVPGPDDGALERFRAEHQPLLQAADDRATVRIGLSVADAAAPCQRRMIAEIEQTTARIAIATTLVTRDAHGNGSAQRAQVAALAADAVDALIIFPADEGAARTAVERLAGKPVVVVGAQPADTAYTCSLSTTPELLGRGAGELCLGLLERARVVEIRGPGSDGDAYHRGFTAALDLGLAATPQAPR